MSRNASISVVALTDVGLARERNEDSYCVGNLDDKERTDATTAVTWPLGERGPLIVVCDGMGGTVAGDRASEIATEVIWQEMLDAQTTGDLAVFARLLRRAVRRANRRIGDEARQHPELEGMGTTVSAAAVVGTTLLVAQIGDSRAYVQRAGTLTQVTRDQSVISALRQSGQLAEYGDAPRGLILQALGTQVDVDVSLSIAELCRGDRLLVCSDGLHSVVPDVVLQASMRDYALAELSSRLLELVRNGGAPDNVTLVVADFAGEDFPEPVEGQLPEFTELDPADVGGRATTHTSRVARRLAARAGLGRDSGPQPIPATGQYMVVTDQMAAASTSAGRRTRATGPADSALRENSGLGLVAWIAAAVVLGAALAFILWS